METVEVDGIIYQIGKHYVFSDEKGVSGYYGKLESVGLWGDEHIFYCDDGVRWRYCNIVIGELGTTTPAPVKLIDGAAYQFDLKETKGLVGILGSYEKHGSTRKMFLTSSNGYFTEYNSEHCTNIIPLVPGVKS